METTPPALAARNLTYRTTSTVVAKDGEKPLVTKALQGQLTVPLQYQCTIDNLFSHHPAGGWIPFLYHNQADTGSEVLEAFYNWGDSM